jgi:DNA-binding CsgD family transcriptional regulator
MQLFGREQELAVLYGLVDDVLGGRGRALVLTGPRGVGLTSVLDQALLSALEVRVIRVLGVKAESDLPFAALDRLCLDLRDRFEALSPSKRATLQAAVGGSDDRRPSRTVVAHAVLALLADGAQHQPIVCCFDDAEWLDPASADVLAFVARRLNSASLGLIFALHEQQTSRAFDGIERLEVDPLRTDVARQLVDLLIPGPLEARVRDRIVCESGGLPLGLVELPRQLTAEELAGLAEPSEPLPAGARLRQAFDDIEVLPIEAQLLVLLAAADPGIPAPWFWDAAERLGLGADAGVPVERKGILCVGSRVRFAHPLFRLVVYDAAPVGDRRRVHRALAEAIDGDVDPERKALHRAAASLAPDEDVASALEAAATTAKGRGDAEKATSLFERAARLTSDRERRFERLLAAAQAAVSAGLLSRATSLLGQTSAPLNELQRAQAERVRAIVGLASGQGPDRITMMLSAARAFESLSLGLARETYLEAIEAAVYTTRPGSRTLVQVTEAVRAAPPAESPQSGSGRLLDALGLFATGREDAPSAIKDAVESLRAAPEPRWLALGALAAAEIWDDEALHDLCTRGEELTSALGVERTARFGFDALANMDDVLAGRMAVAASFGSRDDSSGKPDDRRSGCPLAPGELLAVAWRGGHHARALIEAGIREAFTRELGLCTAAAWHSMAVLELGLANYQAARGAAREACADASMLYVVSAALPDLIEAAARSGAHDLAVSSLDELTRRVLRSGTNWALGLLARSRALLEDGHRADAQYLRAIEHLRCSRASPQLARAHLLYGEWLRRERRRREAREQLRTARDMFIFMGAQTFAERARVELAASGEQATRTDGQTVDQLTPQEAQIAQLVGEGASNAEVGARLFISPRTVEYHLHKVFRKLGISSRTQLASALARPRAEPEGAGSRTSSS